jgi:hypothetical protein
VAGGQKFEARQNGEIDGKIGVIIVGPRGCIRKEQGGTSEARIAG